MREDRRLRVPASLQEPFRAALVAAADVSIVREGLISVMRFGCDARRQAGPLADIDVRLVAEGRPRSLDTAESGEEASSAERGNRQVASETLGWTHDRACHPGA